MVRTLLGSRRRALSALNRFSDRPIRVAIILLPLSHLVVQLHLVRKPAVPYLEVLPRGCLEQLNRLLHSVLRHHRLSVVHNPLLCHLQLLLLVVPRRRLVDLQFLVRSLLLEALDLLLLKQLHLVLLSHHNQLLEAAYLVPQHLLVHRLSLHLVRQATQHLVLQALLHLVQRAPLRLVQRALLHLVLQAPPHLVQLAPLLLVLQAVLHSVQPVPLHLVQPQLQLLVAQGVHLGCQVLLYLVVGEHLGLRVTLCLVHQVHLLLALQAVHLGLLVLLLLGPLVPQHSVLDPLLKLLVNHLLHLVTAAHLGVQPHPLEVRVQRLDPKLRHQLLEILVGSQVLEVNNGVEVE